MIVPCWNGATLESELAAYCCLLVLLLVLRFLFLHLLLRQLLGLFPLCTRTKAWATLLARSSGDQGAEKVGLPWVVQGLAWNHFQAAFGLS